MTIQERLKKIREIKNYSVNYVNTMLGINIESIESGKDMDDIDTTILTRLSNVYKVPVEFIMYGFDRVGDIKEPKITSSFILMLEVMYDCKIFDRDKSPKECFDDFVKAVENLDK